MHGIRSRTGWYRAVYAVSRPLSPLLTRFVPRFATSTEGLGRAMIRLAFMGSSKRVLESADINALAALYR
jgi:hypothetical protein